MIKGYIFDLDGVIADTAELHFLAWKRLAKKCGISIDKEFNNSLKGISRVDSLELILKRGNKEHAFTERQKDALMTEKNDDYVSLLDTITPKDALPGVTSFLEEAKRAGIECAIASASKNAPLILEKLGLSAYFKEIVDPNTLEKGKPNPEIFIKAAEQLGLSADEVIGFEDAQAGVDAIKSAKMYAVGVCPEGKQLKGADQMIKSFEGLTISELME